MLRHDELQLGIVTGELGEHRRGEDLAETLSRELENRWRGELSAVQKIAEENVDEVENRTRCFNLWLCRSRKCRRN